MIFQFVFIRKDAGSISPRSLPILSPDIIWLPWQCPLRYRKTRSRSILCTQSTFIQWKDRKNWSTISWDIPLNKPVFLSCRTRYSQMSSIYSGVTGAKFTKFLHDIVASFTLLMCSLRWQHHILLGNAKATNKGSERLFYKMVVMATSFEVSEKMSTSIICNQNAFIRWKDCENRSSILR